jgi:hypothetical protein
MLVNPIGSEWSSNESCAIQWHSVQVDDDYPRMDSAHPPAIAGRQKATPKLREHEISEHLLLYGP